MIRECPLLERRRRVIPSSETHFNACYKPAIGSSVFSVMRRAFPAQQGNRCHDRGKRGKKNNDNDDLHNRRADGGCHKRRPPPQPQPRLIPWLTRRIWPYPSPLGRQSASGSVSRESATPRSRRLTGRPRWRGEAKSARQGRGGPAQQRTRPNPIAAARTQQATPPRGGSKTAQVVATPGPGPIYSGIVDQPAFGRLRH